jgi:hypothetical protein
MNQTTSKTHPESSSNPRPYDEGEDKRTSFHATRQGRWLHAQDLC